MSTTVGDVLMLARDRHPAFTRERHPDPVCRRFLLRYLRRLVSKIAIERPNELAGGVTFDVATMTPTSFTNGLSLGSGDVRSVRARPIGAAPTSQNFLPVAMRPHHLRLVTRTAWPWASVASALLYLGGTLEDWQRAFQTVQVDLVPTVPDVTAQNADAINLLQAGGGPLPSVDAIEACALQVAAFMASRHTVEQGEVSLNPALIQAEADQAEADFLAALRNRSRATTFQIREVW